tara:strand:- start:15713 stop:16657 length:945 start_codon:yes stop_codon:yes gene_type:complete
LSKINLYKTWNDFEVSCSDKSPYDLRIWKEVWLRHFSEDYNFEYISNSNFFVPLKYRDFEASIIGDKDIVDYNNILYIENERKDFLDLIDQVFELDINRFTLYSISENSPTFNLLRNENILSDYCVDYAQEDVSPYLTLPKSWDEYMSYLPKKKRHELRRKIRRLEENSDFLSGDLISLDDKDEILEEFLRLHKISSDEKRIFMTNKMELFFKDLIEEMLKEKSLKYSYLKINNQTVACSISFMDQKNRFLYNSGFDPSYNNFSSGLLNHAFAIKRSIQEGLKTFDFMRGNERYKYDLGGVDKNIYTFQISKNE